MGGVPTPIGSKFGPTGKITVRSSNLIIYTIIKACERNFCANFDVIQRLFIHRTKFWSNFPVASLCYLLFFISRKALVIISFSVYSLSLSFLHTAHSSLSIHFPRGEERRRREVFKFKFDTVSGTLSDLWSGFF